MTAVREEIRSFILENFLFTDESDALKDDDSLLELGIVDSTGVLDLVTHIEEHYHVTVELDEFVPENLDSVDQICTFLDTKLPPPASATPTDK